MSIVDPDNLELERCLCGAEARLGFTTCTEIYGVPWQDMMVGCTSQSCYRAVSVCIDSDSPAEREAAQTLVAWQWNAFILAVRDAQTKTI